MHEKGKNLKFFFPLVFIESYTQTGVQITVQYVLSTLTLGALAESKVPPIRPRMFKSPKYASFFFNLVSNLLQIGTSSHRYSHLPCNVKQSEKTMTLRQSGKSSLMN